MRYDSPYGSASVESDVVELDGQRVVYDVAGDPDAPVVVLLHGGGLDSADLSWRHALPALAADYRVYALDWPGYGRSDRPERTPTTDYYVEVLGRFLDATGVSRCRTSDSVGTDRRRSGESVENRRVALVGVSMGGGIALGFALDHPDRVSAVVPVDSYGLGGEVPGGVLGALLVRVPYVTRLSYALLRRSRRLTALSVSGVVGPSNRSGEFVEDVWAAVRRPGAGEAFRAFQRAEVGFGGLRTNYLDRLPDLEPPALFVHGERDPLVPAEWAVRAAQLADADLRVFAGTGHWVPRERPAAFHEVVRAFLAGIVDGERRSDDGSG